MEKTRDSSSGCDFLTVLSNNLSPENGVGFLGALGGIEAQLAAAKLVDERSIVKDDKSGEIAAGTHATTVAEPHVTSTKPKSEAELEILIAAAEKAKIDADEWTMQQEEENAESVEDIIESEKRILAAEARIPALATDFAELLARNGCPDGALDVMLEASAFMQDAEEWYTGKKEIARAASAKTRRAASMVINNNNDAVTLAAVVSPDKFSELHARLAAAEKAKIYAQAYMTAAQEENSENMEASVEFENRACSAEAYIERIEQRRAWFLEKEGVRDSDEDVDVLAPLWKMFYRPSADEERE